MSLSPAQSVDAAVAEVRRIYRLAVDKASGSSLLDFWSSSTDQARANLETLGNEVERWASVRRGWALAGARPDGSSYGLAAWLSEGREYASAAATHAAAAYDATLFSVFGETISATAGEAAALAGDALQLAPYLIGAVAIGVACLYLYPLYRKAVAS
jgi:hypothetical protein